MMAFFEVVIAVLSLGLVQAQSDTRMKGGSYDQTSPIKLSSLPPGQLLCEGAQVVYTISDQDLQGHLVPSDPSHQPVDASIDTVHIGFSGSPDCQAKRNHHGNHVLTTPYKNCGFRSSFNRLAERMIYTNEIEVLVWLPADPPSVRRKVHFPVVCSAKTTANLIIPTTKFELDFSEPLSGDIMLPASLGIRKVHRERAFGERDVFVNILTLELEERHHHGGYTVVGRRVFVTPTEDPTVGIQTELMQRVPEFVSVTRIGPHKIIYETLDLGLDGHEQYVFHVDAMVCSTVIPNDRNRCTEVCLKPLLRDRNNRTRAGGDVGVGLGSQDRRSRTRPIGANPKRAPPVRIDGAGVPRFYRHEKVEQ